MVKDIADLSMYVVPKGYNIQKSVYAIDVAFSEGTVPQPEQIPLPAEADLEAALETGEHNEKEEDTKETKGSEPQPGAVTQPGELEAGQHKEKEKHKTREEDTKETKETARGKATVGEGNSKKDDQNEGKKTATGNERWTPGVVRYAATQLVEANWNCLHEFVECSGDTSTEKLATFKRGMAKHGVTEV